MSPSGTISRRAITKQISAYEAPPEPRPTRAAPSTALVRATKQFAVKKLEMLQNCNLALIV
jgi:hypothetical protein